MNNDDFEALILYSVISVSQDNGVVSFVPYKGWEETVAELVKKNHLENMTMTQFEKLATEHMPLIQAKQKLREKKVNDFINMSPEKIARLPLEQKIEHLENVFHKYQTKDELSDICSKNKDKLKALLYSIKLPKDFWQSEELQADRFVSLVADNQQIVNNMKNWQNISMEDKKATIKATADIIEYVYNTPLEIGFYTSEEYRKRNNLDGTAHVFGAYQEKGKIFFNTDRLKNSDNYMGVSVVFHEFTHKRQEETEFGNPLINRLFDCKINKAVDYESRNIDTSLPEYGDIYSLMPTEMHAYAMQKYVENMLVEKTGIEKTQAHINKSTQQVHDKSFAMAMVVKYHSI